MLGTHLVFMFQKYQGSETSLANLKYCNKMADLSDKLFEEIQWSNQVFLGNFFYLKLSCKALFHESQLEYPK